jgi:D-alanyl-D-alanine carboxypeptidase (penicillin-binding protein 5/6)
MGIYVAMIGEPDRVQRAVDAKRLLDWAFRQYSRVALLDATQTVIDVPVRDRPNVRVSLVAQAPLTVTVKLGATMTREITAPPEIVSPARKGQVVGTVRYSVGDRVIGARKLVVGADVAEPSPFERIRAGIGRVL